MKKLFALTIAFVLLTSFAFAAPFDATQLPAQTSNNNMEIVPGIDQYSPTLQIQFPEYQGSFTMSITCDGQYYYDIGYNGYIATYELDGTLVGAQTMSDPTAVRSVFYYDVEDMYYIKPFGTDLYTVDPTTGTTSVLYSAIFQNSNSCVAFDMCTGLMYEHYAGDVWVHDITTGQMVNQFVLTPFYGYTYPIATNHDALFTTESAGGTVHVYDMDGNWLEDVTVTGGDWGWTLSYCFYEELLFLGDRNGDWYGFAGCEGGCAPPPDWDMRCEMTIVDNFVPCDGEILFDVSVRNTGLNTWPSVIGELQPIIGDCNSTPFDFDITRVITNNLASGETYEGRYFYAVGNVCGLGLTSVAMNVQVGGAVNDYLDVCCEEFMFVNPWGRTGGNVEWGTEWLVRDGDYNVPTTTALGQNYPNPFNATTTIPFTLENSGHVTVTVYNLSGQVVETLADGVMDAGQHTVSWDASSVASGVYFYTLETGEYTTAKKLNLLK
ncbi:MAG: T9SS type A sorting domain-containing protein [candidate division Zixibacteria bacterium]|nr:T9SS type A sorting domain-containing protein [candidate division Zixibacteria bacterium]